MISLRKPLFRTAAKHCLYWDDWRRRGHAKEVVNLLTNLHDALCVLGQALAALRLAGTVVTELLGHTVLRALKGSALLNEMLDGPRSIVASVLAVVRTATRQVSRGSEPEAASGGALLLNRTHAGLLLGAEAVALWMLGASTIKNTKSG